MPADRRPSSPLEPPRSHGRLVLAAAGLAFAVALTGSARADDPDPAPALALFQEGKALADAGKYVEACAKLQASYRLVKKLGTLLNLADCNEKTGHTATAWAQFTEARAIAERSAQADRVAFADAHAIALAPKLSRLTLAAASPIAPGLIVKRDGVTLGDGALGTEIPVDPGPHTIEASAPGKREWSSTVTVGAAADHKQITVPALEDEPSAARTERPGTVPSLEHDRARPSRGGGARRRPGRSRPAAREPQASVRASSSGRLRCPTTTHPTRTRNASKASARRRGVASEIRLSTSQQHRRSRSSPEPFSSPEASSSG